MEKIEFIVLRHGYDDHSYIDGENDTSLTSNGIEVVKKASEDMLHKIKWNDVIIRYSAKKRAEETAKILCEYLTSKNINCHCIQEVGLTELYQGRFNFDGMEHNDKVKFLQSCWDDFEFCRLKGDLYHEFGQNKDRQIILNPGANHAEWSASVAGAVLNILNDMDQPRQLINITHRGAILEIQKIIEMANGIIPLDQVEKYETIQMNYCQDYLLHVDDLIVAKQRIKKYIYERKSK